jgi:hypothetical protein
MKFANTIDVHKWEVAFTEVRTEYRTRKPVLSPQRTIYHHVFRA